MAENCKQEASELPLLTGCPADSEYFIVGNATGGKGVGKYARRLWSAIKGCTTGGDCCTASIRIIDEPEFTITNAYTDIIYTSSDGVGRLPILAGNENLVMYIKNRGTGSLRLNT